MTSSITNCNEKKGILPVHAGAEMGQHIISINKPGPQDIFAHLKKDTGSNIHTINISWYTTPSKPIILVMKSTPQLQLLGILFQK